jgi:hypothetical protein
MVEDSSGARTYTPSAYGFHIGAPASPSTVLDLRVPVPTLGAWRVLLVRDGSSYASDLDVWNDAQHFLYDQILVDPAWLWRDNQLAFYYLTRPGVTTDYYSAVSTRCGQDPWPGTGTPPDVLFADAVGVIHRHTGFRDCAGLGVVTTGAAPRRNFAAYGPEPRIVQHELGHALFGLGDEYWEPQSSREVPGQPPDPVHCVCCDENGRQGSVDANGNIVFAGPAGTAGGGAPMAPGPTVGGGVAPRHGTFGNGGTFGGVGGFGGATTGAGGAGGTVTINPMCMGPPCAGWIPPASCRLVAPLCPPIASTCVLPNIFPDLTTCQTQAALIATHPGVEASVAPTSCRQLCGGPQKPCPCVPANAQVWIVDRQHPPLSSMIGDDIMAQVPPMLLFNGGACERCLETTFCLLWEIGRGQSPTDAHAWCFR